MVFWSLSLANFRFAWWMILGQLKCQYHSCALVSNLSFVGSPNSTTCKEPDNHRGEDVNFDVLSSPKAIQSCKSKGPYYLYPRGPLPTLLIKQHRYSVHGREILGMAPNGCYSSLYTKNCTVSNRVYCGCFFCCCCCCFFLRGLSLYALCT